MGILFLLIFIVGIPALLLSAALEPARGDDDDDDAWGTW